MAEIVLGIIPLIGEALKTYKKVHTELQAFRHYERDLKRTSKKLSIQRDSFKLECWILLKAALDQSTVRHLKADPYADIWSKDINDEFRQNIGSSYESCRDIIQDMGLQLKELEEELRVFTPLTKDQRENEALVDVVRRLKKRVHVTVNRKKYDQIVSQLKESNQDLTGLREKIVNLQEPSKLSSRRCLLEDRQSRGDWGAACKARRASSALYNGLQQAWTCQSSPHGNHSMRLFLDAAEPMKKVPTSMLLSLAVVGKSHDNGRVVPTAFHLSVDSQNMQWADVQTTPPGDMDSPRVRSIEDERSTKRLRMVLPPLRIEESTPDAAIVDSPTEVRPTAAVTPHIGDGTSPKPPTYDLGSILDLCGHFGEHCLCPVQSLPRFIGYLDAPGNGHLRHNFYRDIARSRLISPHDDNAPLTILTNSSLRDVDMHQRLMLARAVAVAALTYFETPWLKDFWRLGDVSLLAGQTQEVGTVLQTLHLEVDLNIKCRGRDYARGLLATSDDDSVMDMVLTPDSALQLSEEDCCRQGIYNKTIHSLGVALVGLENCFDFDPSNSDDVAMARKLSQSSIFGGKYKALVRKCLTYEKDLTSQRNHMAVFESIVGSLEDMVTALAIDEDEDD